MLHTLNRHRGLGLAFGLLVGFVLASTSQAGLIYEENFNAGEAGDNYSAGNLDSQNGWLNSVGNGLLVDATDDNVRGKVNAGLESSRLPGALNGLSGSTKSVTFEVAMRQRIDTDYVTLFSIQQANSSQQFGFGATQNGFVLQQDDGTNVSQGNGTGDDVLSSGGHEWFDHQLTYDFQTDTGSWSVRRQLGDANFSQITAFNAATLGLTSPISPTDWNQIALTAFDASDRFDTISVTDVTSVPEPGSATLMVLGGVTLMMRRRTKRTAN